jgi:hypothetical protein
MLNERPDNPRLKTNRLAIYSVVLSCCWFLFPCGASLGGIVFGYIALQEIKANPGMRGRRAAMAGIIIGLGSLAVLPFEGLILLYFLRH